MRELNGRLLKSRVHGRAALVRSLHSLHRRVSRFANLRASTQQDYHWALAVCDGLAAMVDTARNLSREDH